MKKGKVIIKSSCCNMGVKRRKKQLKWGYFWEYRCKECNSILIIAELAKYLY